MSKLNGKVAVVTGGSSGIGLAVAARFAKEGAHVFITGRRQSELEKARTAIGERVTVAAELKDRKIRVNSLSPGGVETPMTVGGAATKEDKEKLLALYGSWIPLGRVGQPEEIASAALFLASSDSSYLTGSDLVADGGFTQV